MDYFDKLTRVTRLPKAAAQPRPKTNYIAVHCSATPASRDVKAIDIHKMHVQRGFVGIGYHFVIELDGTVIVGRELGAIGAHVEGFNSESIGICYIGGVNNSMTPFDSRTKAQKEAMLDLLTKLKAVYPTAIIAGHKDFPKVAKACPSFDAKSEYKDVK